MGERVKYGSLFSGACDGLSVGFEWACADKGITPTLTYQVEIDPWCRANLVRHWPTVPRYEDIRGLTVPRVDVIVGGFPCQDLSLAGKGEWILGERSGLWFEYLRIIQETQPQGVLIENVPGLLRRGLDVVVEGLIDAGYDVEATRLKASDVGAPISESVCSSCPTPTAGDAQGYSTESGRHTGTTLTDAVVRWPTPQARDCKGGFNKHSKSGRDLTSDVLNNWPTPSATSYGTNQGGAAGRTGVVRESLETTARKQGGGDAKPGLGRDANGLPSRVDRFPAYRGEAQAAWEPPRVLPKAKYPARSHRLKGLGNSVVPQCAYIAAHRLLEKL